MTLNMTNNDVTGTGSICLNPQRVYLLCCKLDFHQLVDFCFFFQFQAESIILSTVLFLRVRLIHQLALTAIEIQCIIIYTVLQNEFFNRYSVHLNTFSLIYRCIREKNTHFLFLMQQITYFYCIFTTPILFSYFRNSQGKSVCPEYSSQFQYFNPVFIKTREKRRGRRDE